MDENTPTTKKTSKDITFPARLGQLKTLKDDSVTTTLSTNSKDLQKILKLIKACQAGNSLLISAQIVKAKPVKKDAKKKPDSQKQKGPRRVRRYPYK
jgi:hypothetical protein